MTNITFFDIFLPYFSCNFVFYKWLMQSFKIQSRLQTLNCYNTKIMSQLPKILLILSFLISNTSLFAQKDAEQITQNIQTANFSNLQHFWDAEVEMTILDQINQKTSHPEEANQQLQLFFNNKSIVGFDKNAERKVGNTLYITGKLFSGTNKYNLTLLLQETKKGLRIVSVRIS